MSRMLATLFLTAPFLSAPPFVEKAAAQDAPDIADTYGPVAEFEGDEDTPLPLTESEPCETQEQEDGVILVCRELTDSERYMSPIPRPTQSDRVIMPGLNDPPCWVTNPGPLCIRVGWAPEPAIMVDVTAFPEPLSVEDVALVSEVEGDGAGAAPVATPAAGARIPIDISEGRDDE